MPNAHPLSPQARIHGSADRDRDATILAVLTCLFALRVAGQAVQRGFALPCLPPFAAFQGSTLAYPVLLAAQLAILVVMVDIVRRVRAGTLCRRAVVGGILAVAGSVYFATMLARLAIGIGVRDAPAWFRAPIPAAFHMVLAAFVLVLAAHHRSAAPGSRIEVPA